MSDTNSEVNKAATAHMPIVRSTVKDPLEMEPVNNGSIRTLPMRMYKYAPRINAIISPTIAPIFVFTKNGRRTIVSAQTTNPAPVLM